MNDELLVYRGKDYIINDKISIHQPTLDDICDYGELKYFNMINTLTSVGADMKWQLWDAGIDYTKISDFELFYSVLVRTDIDVSIILNNINFNNFKLYKRNDNNSYFLYDETNDICIDEHIYILIVNYLRDMHKYKRNDKMPANNSTKMVLIEDDREEYNRNKDKEIHSILTPLISTMINMEGFKYNHETVWNMKISAFMDSVKRIQKIKHVDNLLNGYYCGNINIEKIDRNELDCFGKLN